MASSLDGAPKAYGGDLRELIEHRPALLGALLGCAVTIVLALIFGLRRDCVARFDQGWEDSDRQRYTEEFAAAVVDRCGTDDDEDCLEAVSHEYEARGREVHSITYTLALTEACPHVREDGAFEIDFEPGTLVKLGAEEPAGASASQPEPPPTEAPVEDSVSTPAVPQPTVADDTRRKSAPAPQKPAPRRSKLPKPGAPSEERSAQRGDPFGDARGWSERATDGDPWATAIVAALEGMAVGAFGARMETGTARFQITVCRDGRVAKVHGKGGTLEAAQRARVAQAVRSLRLPRVPATIAAKMSGNCAKIKHTFVWSPGSVDAPQHR